MQADMDRHAQRTIRMDSGASRVGMRDLDHASEHDQQRTQHCDSHSQAAQPLRFER
jgi:hypothetical protein